MRSARSSRQRGRIAGKSMSKQTVTLNQREGQTLGNPQLAQSVEDGMGVSFALSVQTFCTATFSGIAFDFW